MSNLTKEQIKVNVLFIQWVLALKAHTSKKHSIWFLYYLSLISFLILLKMNGLLFASESIERGFFEDLPAVFLMTFGLVLIAYIALGLNEEVNALSKHIKLHFQGYYGSKWNAINKIINIACLLGAAGVNFLWLHSQLNDNVITWFSYRGFINPLFRTRPPELLNIGGFIYYLACLLHWYLYLIAFYLLVHATAYYLFHRNQVVKYSEQDAKMMKSIISRLFRYTTYFCFYTIFYYIALQINDLVIEGYNTFSLHPNRFIMFWVCVVSLVLYSVVTTTLKYYYPGRGIENHVRVDSIVSTENQESIVKIMLPILTLSVYSFLSNTFLSKQAYQNKLDLCFILFVVLTIFMVYSEYSKHKRSEYYLQLNHELNLLSSYAHTVEKLYQELRHYKHDFSNILLSIQSFIDVEDWVNLRTYFNDDVLMHSPVMQTTYNIITYLEPICIVPLKGLILAKTGDAYNQSVEISVEIIAFSKPCNVADSELCRMVGILMDNAIEAAAQSNDKKVIISTTTKEEHILEISILNTYRGMPDMRKIFEKDYSTKGANRGLGLASLKGLIQNHETVQLDTFLNHEWFVQTLTTQCQMQEQK